MVLLVVNQAVIGKFAHLVFFCLERKFKKNLIVFVSIHGVVFACNVYKNRIFFTIIASCFSF